MDPIFTMLIVVILMILVMNVFGNRQRRRVQEMRDAALVIGKEVRTQSGFYGTIVDIDGDAVTLESPSGDESVWHKNVIALEQAPPFAAPEDDMDGEVAEPAYGERLETEGEVVDLTAEAEPGEAQLNGDEADPDTLR
ncbi:MAG: preprotein translocase subunit YajC [Bowdeniella nasicola]|nr:preprotein translocase subunit YajC [Bowdeniella nasicola]